LIRKEAIKIVAEKISNNPIIAANGYLSRDLYEVYDKPSNFYMIGSMGLASSIGLGLALKNRKKTFYIFDGDGNLLMNLGSLVTIGVHNPKNLIHIVFDNKSHESTGGQPTESRNIQLDNIANSTKIKTFKVSTRNDLIRIIEKTKKLNGPILILVRITKSKKKSQRVNIDPIKIKSRFMKSLCN